MVNLSTKITDVTVYRFGACVTRKGGISESDGVVFKITGLPLILNDSSVKIKVFSDTVNSELPAAKDFKIIIEEPDFNKNELSEIDSKIEESEKGILKLKDEIEQLNYWIKYLSQSRIKERHVDEKTGPVKSPLDKRIELLDAKKDKVSKLIEDKTEKKKSLQDAEKARLDLIDKKNSMSAKERDNADSLKKACIITFDSNAFPENTIIQFDYIVPGACWSPSYMVHLNRDYTEADLSLRAVICQYTGEDWENINITLSTAVIQNWTELPDLPSLKIGRRQAPPKKSGYREPPVGAKELYSDFDVEFGVIKPPEMKKAKISQEADREPVPLPVSESADEFISEEEGEETDSDASQLNDLVSANEKQNTGAMLGSGISYDKIDAPLEMAEPMMAAKKMMKSKGLFRAASISSPKIEAKEERRRADGKKRDEGEIDGLFGDFEIFASEDFLNFSKLRMPGITSSERGELKMISDDELYTDISGGVVYADIFRAAFDYHSRNALAVKSLKLPDGYFLPDSYNGYDYAFKAESPVDIPSNKIYHNIKLWKVGLKPELYHITVPRENTSVYRFIKMKNEQDAPLLRGVCDIFCGDNYIATGRINFTAPNGMLELGLGVEQRVKVARNIKFEEETKGIVGSNINLNHSISIEIRNLTPSKIKIQVRERIPDTDVKKEDIKITVTKAEPPWKKYDPLEYSLRSGFVWELEIEPSKEMKLEADYTVTISSKNELVGGNRREA